ncbi:MAG TPA: hemerythrin domain-containing protein [Usitatibacteraceae bacterium]|nr:hemerythrin domain-containing protein [Usitatibacteraceae bacterium]
MPVPQTEPTGAPSPREALAQCHLCIAAMLTRLGSIEGELVRTLPGTPAPDLPDRVRALVAEIDEALSVHIADEEADVFPALLAAAESPARRAQAFELVSSLLVEHREIAELWHALRIALLAAGGGVYIAYPGGTAADFLLRVLGHLERERTELAELMEVLDTAKSRAIAISIAHRHDESCPRIRNCPLKP